MPDFRNPRHDGEPGPFQYRLDPEPSMPPAPPFAVGDRVRVVDNRHGMVVGLFGTVTGSDPQGYRIAFCFQGPTVYRHLPAVALAHAEFGPGDRVAWTAWNDGTEPGTVQPHPWSQARALGLTDDEEDPGPDRIGVAMDNRGGVIMYAPVEQLRRWADPEPDDEPDEVDEDYEPDREPAPVRFVLGDTVRYTGHVDELRDQPGTVVRSVPDEGGYLAVRFHRPGLGEVRVHPPNLALLPAGPPQPEIPESPLLAAPPTLLWELTRLVDEWGGAEVRTAVLALCPPAPERGFALGARVRVAPGFTDTGDAGRVVGTEPETGWPWVHFDDGQDLEAVAPEFLEPDL